MSVAGGAALRPLRLIAFAGAGNWPVWAGLAQGIFAREGIALSHALTPNSRAMAASLFQGEADIALTAIDNVVAYNEGQGETGWPEPTDFVAVMGVDGGFLSLMGRPGVERIADLKGATLSVDAFTTGFAFVLRELLRRAGLGEDDVHYVRVGGGAERLKALIAGEQSATLLNAPLDLVAESEGCRRLASAGEVLGAYQGIVGAVRRPWVEANSDLLTDFIRAFHAALGWLCDPANRAAAVALAQERMAALQGELAERAYEVLLDPERGMFRDLAISRAGVETVLALRSRYARPAQRLDDPSRYVDDRYRLAALQARRDS